MKTLPITRPTLDDPLYTQRNPYQTFLLILAAISSWPLLKGETGSAALEAELSDAAVMLWGVALLAGSLVALLGEFWRGHDWTGHVIERAGLALVGVAALIYATVIWTATDLAHADVSFAVALTAAWGAACLWRCGQITKRLAWIKGLRRELGLG